MKKIDLTGKVFGRLLVLEHAGKSVRGQSLWLCSCSCGNQKVMQYSSLVAGTQSCGCKKREPNLANTTHGQSNTRTYRAWTNMKARCLDVNHQAYHNYGARGITVCERWMTFEPFLEDMGFCPEGLEIERMDNDDGYYKENCKWATRSEQQSNKRHKA